MRTARGLAWLVGQTITVKIISLLSLILLGRLLNINDFGLVGMAYTVMSIAGIVQYIGLQDVLVQRQAHFRRWSNAAFWLSAMVGLAGGAMIAITAPLAARMFGEPRLIGLLLLLAVASPLQTLCAVPQAKLAADLRFRTSVIITGACSAGISVLSVVLAWQGWGAASFLAPVPLMNALQLLLLWAAARPIVRLNPQWRRWKFLLPDTGMNWGITICTVVITTADHVMLGRWFGAHAVGLYFNAVNLSTQMMRLLNTNLMAVLLPSLSRLQSDPQRQVNAFLQASRLLTALMVPACLLQAAVSGPLVRLLIETKWNAAAPVVAMLSIGLAFAFIAGPSTSLMKAQGRFAAVLRLHLMQAAVTVLAVGAAALLTNEASAAWSVSIGYAGCMVVFGPVFLHAAIRPAGLRWRSVVRVYAIPLAASIVAIGAAINLTFLLPDMPARQHDMARVATVTLTSLLLYTALLRWWDKPTWSALRMRLSSLRRSST